MSLHQLKFIILFTGDQVWKLIKRQIEPGYPKTVKLHTLFEKPRASVVVTTWHSSSIFIFGVCILFIKKLFLIQSKYYRSIRLTKLNQTWIFSSVLRIYAS